jgi:CHAT domain-containing protein
VGGEGGFALARAFQHAGARAVLLDLWPLPEAATSELIPSLYSRLDAGETPAEALRAAKLALLQSGAADPMYWAPFVLLDTPAPPR